MSEYQPKAMWHESIRQFDVNEIVEGGVTGLDNLPHQQLADNFQYLLQRLILTESALGLLAPDTPLVPDPDGPIDSSDGNPTGDWLIEILTPPVHAPEWAPSFIFRATHSSGQRVDNVVVAMRQLNASANINTLPHDLTNWNPNVQGINIDKKLQITQPFSTDANGVAVFTIQPAYILINAGKNVNSEAFLYIASGPTAEQDLGDGKDLSDLYRIQVKLADARYQAPPANNTNYDLWEIINQTATPFAPGESPSFTLSNTAGASNRSVNWSISRIYQSYAEGDIVTQLNSGTVVSDSNGKATITSAPIPGQGAGQYVLQVKAGASTRNFTIN